jgi:CRISPR/Cas system-associated endoribonuclease Cas2
MGQTRRVFLKAEILNGWKDISNYLGKGVRTAQRYEREAGLPVRRPSGGSGSVLATKAELDAWLDATPLRQAFRLKTRSSDAVFKELQRSIEEGRQLRQQMKALRNELHRSIELLRASIRFVQTDAQEESVKFQRSRLTVH